MGDVTAQARTHDSKFSRNPLLGMDREADRFSLSAFMRALSKAPITDTPRLRAPAF